MQQCAQKDCHCILMKWTLVFLLIAIQRQQTLSLSDWPFQKLIVHTRRIVLNTGKVRGRPDILQKLGQSVCMHIYIDNQHEGRSQGCNQTDQKEFRSSSCPVFD